MRARFPAQRQGTVYLTEGGQETEMMYKFGYDVAAVRRDQTLIEE
jgi:hypothetical protein